SLEKIEEDRQLDGRGGGEHGAGVLLERFTAGEIADDVSRGPLQPGDEAGEPLFDPAAKFGAFRLACRGCGVLRPRRPGGIDQTWTGGQDEQGPGQGPSHGQEPGRRLTGGSPLFVSSPEGPTAVTT